MAGAAAGRFLTRAFESMLSECAIKKYNALQSAIQAYLGFRMADSAGGRGVVGGSDSYDDGNQCPPMNLREQNPFLPIANIGRIMKKALPANGKIAKDAKGIVQECVPEFISFITIEASEKC